MVAMNNFEVAAFFKKMASLLEFRGENPFRIKAYEKAARNIKSLDEELSAYYDQKGRVPKIPGVGQATKEKVAEILDTGTFREYEETVADIPPGILDILDIPGIGPKTAKLFYERLDVTSVDDLVKAAEQHRIRRLPRMGPGKEENILRSVQRYLENSERKRTPLATAVPIVELIREELNACPCIKELIDAGSLRRRKDTLGDINLLALSDNPEETLDGFANLSDITEVIDKNNDFCSVVYREEVRIDLRIVPEESFGSFLQYYTGSKKHNRHLQYLALQKGYILSEYGFTNTGTDDTIRCEEEKQVYDFLGIDYLVPELREDRGEIEAGMQNRLPELIEIGDIKGDLHVHSTWSDGKNTIEELALDARERGYEYIAITDHSPSTAIANGLSDKRLMEHAREVEKADENIDGIRILSGTECDIRSNGKLDYSNRLLENLDIVIAAVHAGLDQQEKTMTKRMVAALENEHVDILAHPTGRKFGKRGAYDFDLEKVFQTALDNDKILEINSSPKRLDLNDTHARIAKEMGIKVAINTDTHRLDNFSNIRYGVDVARRAWLEPKDVVNTRKLKDIESLLGI